MLKTILRQAGGRVAHNAVRKHTAEGGRFDLKFGFALLRDRRVPVGAKLLALGLGVAATAVINALELPLEALIAVLLPGVGLTINAILNGMEFIAGPLLASALVLPFVAPRPLVEQIRAERLPRPVPLARDEVRGRRR
jgi:hypothetical protein